MIKLKELIMQSNTRPFKNYHEDTKQFVAMLVASIKINQK